MLLLLRFSVAAVIVKMSVRIVEVFIKFNNQSFTN